MEMTDNQRRWWFANLESSDGKGAKGKKAKQTRIQRAREKYRKGEENSAKAPPTKEQMEKARAVDEYVERTLPEFPEGPVKHFLDAVKHHLGTQGYADAPSEPVMDYSPDALLRGAIVGAGREPAADKRPHRIEDAIEKSFPQNEQTRKRDSEQLVSGRNEIFLKKQAVPENRPWERIDWRMLDKYRQKEPELMERTVRKVAGEIGLRGKAQDWFVKTTFKLTGEGIRELAKQLDKRLNKPPRGGRPETGAPGLDGPPKRQKDSGPVVFTIEGHKIRVPNFMLRFEREFDARPVEEAIRKAYEWITGE